jgi:hypothetical protein
MERKMNFVTIDFETAQYARESACSVGSKDITGLLRAAGLGLRAI